MDAATRAELDALRLRAYGPSPDIAGDEAAIARLIALEESALPAARVVQRAAPEGPALLGRGSEPVDAEATPARVVEIAPAAVRHSRPRWHLGLVTAVVLIALPLAMIAATRAATGSGITAGAVPTAAAGAITAKVREARVFTADSESEIVMRVRMDGYFGTYVDVPVGADVPLFPVEGLMTWAEPLGDYYGWTLWIGGARGGVEDENCMLLDGDGTMRADCVSTSLRADGALLLTVPYAEMAPADRPDAMTADQSLGFWWDTDGAITILLSPTPAD